MYLNFERINKEEAKGIVQNNKVHIQTVKDTLYGKHILLVEDHPLNAEISEKLLQRVGCEVVWMQDGAEAVNYFKKSSDEIYDAVLMDIRMPVMDGLQATCRIRAIDSDYTKNIPIIAMTANAYEEDVRHSMEAGMNTHLSKPIDPNILYDTLMRFL